ncbi:MAG: Spermine synthase [Candidatus Krumholzibacteriota bacterium]|nr:Spermine synthase [Candidatus Krumholzibacteriota bacterium]
MIFYLLSIGFVSILAQVVLLRELNVAFFGVELIYIIAIAVWLLSTGVGALLRDRSPVSHARVSRLLIWFSFLLLAEVVVVRSMRLISGAIPGTFLPFGVQIAGLAAAIVPVGVLLGALFRRAAALYIAHDGLPEESRESAETLETGSRRTSASARTLARAYAIESAGGLAGGLFSTVSLAAGLQNFAVAIVCGAVAFLTVLLALRRGAAAPPTAALALRHDAERKRARVASILGLAIFAGLGAASPRIDRALTTLVHPALVASKDSPYGRVTVTSSGGQFVVYENDAIAYETESVSAEEIVHIAAANLEDIDRVLVLGGGLEGTAAEIAKYAPRRVDVVELNPVIVSLSERHLPAGYRAALGREGVSLHIEDPRRFAARTPDVYDLVLIGAADPASGQTNRFFTREFFAECARVLSPGGVVAFRLMSSENVWTPLLSYRNASIVKALEEVFEDAVVLPGTQNVIIASNRSLSRDTALLGGRLRDSGVETKLVTPAYIEYLYTNDRFGEIDRRLSETPVASNTDSRPVCYRYSGLIWLSKFFPSLITADVGSPDLASGRGASVVVSLAALAGAVVAFFRRAVRFRRAALAALAGFVGMALETVMILHYQVESGVLYQNLGVLLMALMAGLAAGAAIVPRLALARQHNSFSLNRICGLALAGGFSLLSIVSVGFLRAEGATGLWTVSFLLLLCGFLVAGVFAYASLIGASSPREQSAMIGPLYAADLLGGCAGSIVCCIFLIPFAGMEQTAGVAFLVSLVALLAV